MSPPSPYVLLLESRGDSRQAEPLLLLAVKALQMEDDLRRVNESGMALGQLPDERRTAEVCKAAVQQNGRALQYVPEERRTAELCKVAVKQNGEALQYVPEERRTAEVCQAAVQQNG